jgi:hypothetical protein
VKNTAVCLSLALLALSALSMAQSTSQAPYPSVAYPTSGGNAGRQPASKAVIPFKKRNTPPKPFSRLALGAGFSPLGVNMQAATNVNKYLNLRGSGNVLNYSISNVNVDGFNVSGSLNLASAGASLDFYPMPHSGLRVSPGLLFYNANGASATFTVPQGSSFTVNKVTYYAWNFAPVSGTGSFGLHTTNPAFTITTGWGNMIPRHDSHLSFPVEVGVALIGAPTVNVILNAGQVCNAQGQNCINVATYAPLQSNLQAQINKYKSNLDPLKTYPIVSGGVAYSFNLR